MTEIKAGKDFYTELRKIPALAVLPADEFVSLARTVYSELELRVGSAPEGLSEAQLADFEALITYEQAHPELAGQLLGVSWLVRNHPNYREIVQEPPGNCWLKSKITSARDLTLGNPAQHGRRNTLAMPAASDTIPAAALLQPGSCHGSGA
ncbi:DUF5663 domain-containing protein [Arthrobacter alpinus]|nr:DUF5663 domain-containing protein [Arthrobacter alpinus]